MIKRITEIILSKKIKVSILIMGYLLIFTKPFLENYFNVSIFYLFLNMVLFLLIYVPTKNYNISKIKYFNEELIYFNKLRQNNKILFILLCLIFINISIILLNIDSFAYIILPFTIISAIFWGYLFWLRIKWQTQGDSQKF